MKTEDKYLVSRFGEFLLDERMKKATYDISVVRNLILEYVDLFGEHAKELDYAYFLYVELLDKQDPVVYNNKKIKSVLFSPGSGYWGFYFEDDNSIMNFPNLKLKHWLEILTNIYTQHDEWIKERKHILTK